MVAVHWHSASGYFEDGHHETAPTAYAHKHVSVFVIESSL